MKSTSASRRQAPTCRIIGLLVLWALSWNTVAVSQNTAAMRPKATIGLSIDNLILGAYGIALLPEGRVLIADKLEYNVKCFDRSGRLTASTGKKGRRDGEFRGPGPIAASDTLVAVADFASTRIQLFSSSLKYRTSFAADAPVFDMCFDAAGGLWVGTLPNAAGTRLVRYDCRGRPTASIALKHSSPDLFDNIFTMAICGTKDIVIAYMTHNTVEIWDTSGRFVSEFHVTGIRPRADRKSIRTGWFSDDVTVPENNIYQDVAADAHGRIYLLAEAASEHLRRDVCVVSREGNLICRLLLSDASQAISVDAQGNLFSIEGGRTLIRIYKFGELP